MKMLIFLSRDILSNVSYTSLVEIAIFGFTNKRWYSLYFADIKNNPRILKGSLLKSEYAPKTVALLTDLQNSQFGSTKSDY